MKFYNQGDSAFTGGALYPTSVHGIRAFKLLPDGKLTGSAVTQYTWKPGWNQAKCTPPMGFVTVWFATRARHSEEEEHRCPMGWCGCGFWAYWDGTNDRMETPDAVAGIIEGKGKAVVGTKGMRIEQARVVALTTPPILTQSRDLRAALRTAFRRHVPLVAATLAYFDLVALIVFEPPWWGAALLSLPFVALMGGVVWLMLKVHRGAQPVFEREDQIRPVWEKTLARFKDVQVFDSQEEMLAAFPLSDPRE